MKLETIKLCHVEFMPKQLEPGILYVSDIYGTAAHLCACGCGAKIRTPLGPTEWTVDEDGGRPSLWPSVGNWQQACQSHYIVRRGQIIWCKGWSPEEILAGRRGEEARREAYYSDMYKGRSIFARAWSWLKKRFFG